MSLHAVRAYVIITRIIAQYDSSGLLISKTPSMEDLTKNVKAKSVFDSLWPMAVEKIGVHTLNDLDVDNENELVDQVPKPAVLSYRNVFGYV